MTEKTEQKNIIERPPVIAVMGHIDHGKSKLLDYIRKSNVVEGESGGITQHISAYEVERKDAEGNVRHITFLDTPGHEAFSAMRERGANIADIAVLIVSAEDGVKAQTLEALESIKNGGIPFIVAINKIDKPAANVQKTKNELVEHGVYIEGMGGDIPFVPISAITGEGVDDLLDTMLLVAEMEELTANTDEPASGFVLESNVDPTKGISATLIIKNGTLKKGMCISAGESMSPVRAIENFLGKHIDEAKFSSPVRIIGFNSAPETGVSFSSFAAKKEAEAACGAFESQQSSIEIIGNPEASVIIPLIIKTDALGTLEAVEKELAKIKHEKVGFRIIQKGVGNIAENDTKVASGSPNTIIIGFRVKADRDATAYAEKFDMPVKTFAIIYNITDYLEEVVKERVPKERVEEATGKAKIIRIFSKTKDKQVLGAKMQEGEISLKARINILRRDVEIGKGVVLELQEQKVKKDKVSEGAEFGLMVESKMDIAEGDKLIPFTIVEK
ncbi:translation initiation factor IF-2 [Patescibacteria group bacterium]